MRRKIIGIAMTLAVVSPGIAMAKDKAEKPAKERESCDGLAGSLLTACAEAAKKASKRVTVSNADAKLFNDTANAAKAKIAAKDYAGAAADYQSAIDKAPKSVYLHRFYAGVAIAKRQQAIAAYNAIAAPTLPAPGSPNDVVLKFNAATTAVQSQRAAAAVPLIKQGQAAAAQAATLADAQADRAIDGVIGEELREDASLLYQLDHDAVLASPRPSADLEAKWLRTWIAATNPLAEASAAKYGFATAATLVGKDPAAALTLAEEVRAKTGSDLDGMLGYADIVVAAKVPAGDPRRTKALADLTQAEPSVGDGGKRVRLRRLKTALAGSS